MDTPAEAMAYDDMDHGPVNRQFVDDLLEFHSDVDEVLDLGSGTARIPIELCRRQETIRVVAAELSLPMLDVARINIEIASLVERILLVHGDAQRLGFANGRFTVVMSNSLLHHLPDPLPALQQAVRLAAENGALFFRDLLRPPSVQEVERLVELHAGGEGDHARQLFRQSLHAALSLDEVRQLIATLGFPADTVQASSDRHWTWAAHK